MADTSTPPIDPSGTYRHPAAVSYGVVGFYVLLIVALFSVSRGATYSNFPYITELLAFVLLFFLARYLSTRYWMNADRVGAWRLVGSRSVALEDIRKIEFANLRDLGPTGMFGGWGWRGRMWSPLIGTFDAISTGSDGLLITAGAVPMYISPKDPETFARELSRRARSYRETPLEIDVGQRAGEPDPRY